MLFYFSRNAFGIKQKNLLENFKLHNKHKEKKVNWKVINVFLNI